MGKLIAMDLDGTLLPEGTFLLNPEYYEVIRKLHDEGNVIVAASGRHYSSMRKLLKPVFDDVIFLCANGTFVTRRGTFMDHKCLPDDLYLSVLKDMRKTGGYVGADTWDAVWSDSHDEAFMDVMEHGYRMDIRRIGDLSDVWDRSGAFELEEGCRRGILKIALHVSEDAGRLADEIRRKYGTRANIMASGAKWVDCVPLGADKGIALADIQKKLGIGREDTIAFGDNGNDVGMLQCAGESYCVENGRNEAKEAADHVIGPMQEDSVLKVLKTLLRKAD